MGVPIGGGVFGLTSFILLVLVIEEAHPVRLRLLDADFGGIDAFGRLLFSDGIVPFELSSALLMVAVVGAVAVARGKQGEEAHVPPSGQPGLAVRSSGSASFATVSATRAEGQGHAK